MREPHVFASLQAPPLSEALHERYREHGVDLRLGETEIPAGADLVVAGIGVEPNVELGRDAGLEVRSGIVVDERFETSRPGVYAIGDVAEFFDPVFGRHRRIEHWSNAAYHGTTLGQILAGEDARYDIVSSFFSEQFGRSFKLFGDPTGHDTTALEGDFARGAGRPALPARAARRSARSRPGWTRTPKRAQGRDQSRRGAVRVAVTLAGKRLRGGSLAQLGDRTALDRHDPHAVDGRGAEGERRPSRHRDGARAARLPALHAR